jgi:hypothetical protein
MMRSACSGLASHSVCTHLTIWRRMPQSAVSLRSLIAAVPFALVVVVACWALSSALMAARNTAIVTTGLGNNPGLPLMPL